MTPDQAAAFVIAQAALLNCEVAGMVAENMQRAAVGHSMAFTEENFVSLATRYEGVLSHNAVIGIFRSAQS